MKNKTEQTIKEHFTAKRIVLMAVFVALGYAVSRLEIPIFPATPYLKLDFGNVFILLIGFLFGPIEGVVVCVIKELLRLIGSSSSGVGELVNILATCSFILLPSIVYRFKKGLKYVVPSLAVACVIGTIVALLTNRFITFPLYMGDGAKDVFNNVFWFVLAFNAIKTVAVSVVTMLLYKRLSTLLKRIENR
jgi:ECF transporter S component (folate family)